LGDRQGIQLVKQNFDCWYFGVVTKALNVLKFLLEPVPLPSSLATVKPRIVWHSDTGNLGFPGILAIE